MTSPLSHVDESGHARMVDVGDKPVGRREATARARVRMGARTRELALGGGGPKGPVLEVARLAGIQAAKRTAELIPMCHVLPLDAVEVTISPEGEDVLAVLATARTTGRTGVEMEALTAAAVAALTLVDMLKAVEKGLVVEEVLLLAKSGGTGGDWTRPGGPGR